LKTIDVRLPDGSLLCKAGVADGFVSRGVGLLGKRSLGADEGLLIKPCSSVHTYFMRFPIDVLYLSENDRILKIVTMKPFRFSLGGKGAKKVLELSAGKIEAHSLREGQTLSIQ
jgi:uncharacterized membrane protein (UPF0127 family)